VREVVLNEAMTIGLWQVARTIAARNGNMSPEAVADLIPGCFEMFTKTMVEMARAPRELPASPGWTLDYSVDSGRLVLVGPEESTPPGLRVVK
jgi:hypothetical protein